jgi:hypothetical protein
MKNKRENLTQNECERRKYIAGMVKFFFQKVKGVTSFSEPNRLLNFRPVLTLGVPILALL